MDSLFHLLQRLTLSLGDALLRDRVRRAEFLGEEAHTQLLKHPVHASERIGNKSSLGQRLDGGIVGILQILHREHELIISVQVRPQLRQAYLRCLQIARQVNQLIVPGIRHESGVHQVIELPLHI